MKTLKVIVLLPFAFSKMVAFGQDTIFVSQKKVTSIQFPVNITSPVNADRSLSASIKEANVLSISAVSNAFKPSKLEVKTVDGKSYFFPVAYSFGRSGQLKRIGKIESYQKSVPEIRTVKTVSQQLAEEIGIRSVSFNRSGSIKSQLGSISISGTKLFYKLRIKNNSNLNYDIDFIRFYIRDLKTAKRTVTQEQEILPVQSHGYDDKTIEANSVAVYVFTLNKFPLANDQALCVEVYEKAGSRHQYLKVKQSDIEKARLFK